MTEAFDRTLHRVAEPRWFEDFALGEHFPIPSRTVTEAHFSAFQAISADNHPIHYDVEHCRERGHRGSARPRLPDPVFHRGRSQRLRPSDRRLADRLCRAIVEISEACLRRRHALPAAGDRGIEAAALDRCRHTQSQNGELVLTGEQKILLRKRPPA